MEHLTNTEFASKIFTVKQLCKELEVSRQTILNWEKSGLLLSKSIGGRKFFMGSDLLDAFQKTQSK
jgi:DNA-binding transcriptional MerR regulator